MKFARKNECVREYFLRNGWAKVSPNGTVRLCIDRTSDGSTKITLTLIWRRDKINLHEKGKLIRTIRHVIIHEALQFRRQKMKTTWIS